MKETLKKFSEHTVVPMSLGLAFIVAAGVWEVGHYSFQAEANAREIEILKSKQDAIGSIQTDIAVIKAKLESIDERLGNR